MDISWDSICNRKIHRICRVVLLSSSCKISGG